MHSEAVNQWLDADHVRSMAEGLLTPSPRDSSLSNEEMFGTSFEGFADLVDPVPTKARQNLSDAQSRAASAGILREEIEPTPAPVVATPVQEARAEVPIAPLEPAKPIRPVEATSERPLPVLNHPPVPVQPTLIQPAQITVTPVRAPEPALETRPALIESPFKIAPEPAAPALPPREAFRPLPLSTRLQAFGTWLKEQIPTRAYFICDRHGEIVVDEVGSEKLVKVARTLAHASSSAGRQVGDDENLGSLHVKIGPDRVMEVVPRHSHFGLVVLGIIVPRPLSRDAVASVSRALGTALAEPSAPRQ